MDLLKAILDFFKREIPECVSLKDENEFLELIISSVNSLKTSKNQNASELYKKLNETQFLCYYMVMDIIIQGQLYKLIDLDRKFISEFIEEFLEFNDIKYRKDFKMSFELKGDLIYDFLIFQDDPNDPNNDEYSNPQIKRPVGIKIHNIFEDYQNRDFDFEPYQQYLMSEEYNIRLIHVFEPFLYDFNKLDVLKNIILHACNKIQNKVYARQTEVIVKPAAQMKEFFLRNNIQGYRNAKTAFVLIDKKSKEELMCYTVGNAYFGKGLYDAEIARGGCKLGTVVVGGASKLWNFIIDYYKNKDLNGNSGSVDSIVYYVDLNHYSGTSMGFLEGNEYVKTTPGFWNFWVENKELKNREPKRHSLIMQKIRDGKIIEVKMAGTMVNVWKRNSNNKRLEEFISSHKRK